jgi:hypothetical protein
MVEMASQPSDPIISAYEGAIHSAYKNQTGKFTEELLELYAPVK